MALRRPGIASRCRQEFSSKARARGELYRRGGRVRLLGAEKPGAHGTVRGSRPAPYAVSVRALEEELPELEVSCTCPHFAGGSLCKHLWAFLLELDEKDAAPAVPGTGPIDVYDVEEDDDAALEVLTDELERDGEDPLHAGRRDPAWLRFAAAGPPAVRARGDVYYLASFDPGEPDASLEVQLFEEVRSGSKTRLKPLTLHPLEMEGYAPEDERALQALIGCAGTGLGLPGAFHLVVPAALRTCAIAPGLQPLVLPLLARTGRLCRLPRDAPPSLENLAPLRWDGDDGYTVLLRMARRGETGAWQLESELCGPGAPRVSELDAVLESGVAVAGDRIVRLAGSRIANLVEGFRRNGPIEVAGDQIPELLERVTALGLPPVELPEELGWSEETGSPRGRLEIRAPDARTPATLLYADVLFDYGGRRFHAQERERGFADRDRRRLVRRDPGRESALASQIAEQGLRELPLYQQGHADVQLERRRMSEHVAALLELGWDVEAEGVRVHRYATPRLSVRTGVDWFELEGEVRFGDQTVALPELLAAAGRGDTTIALGDGSRGLLPAEWLARVARLAELGVPGERESGGIRFLPSQALLIDTLLASQPEVDVDSVFRRTCQRIERAGRPKPARAPRGLRGAMRPYQREGLGWLEYMGTLGLGACLADDMGLGKTLQALALLAARRRSRPPSEEARTSLAVVPASLVHSWLAEAARFTPDLSVVDYTGPDRSRLGERLFDADLVVTTYGTLRRDAEKLAGRRFDCVILDEAQAIKNARAQVSRAARLLRAEQRVALSGTPVENHLGELWALFDFLNPGMLGPTARRAATLADPDDAALAGLGKALSPFILRRTKDQVLKELPPKTEQTLTCTLEGGAKRLYRELRDHYRASLLERIDAKGLARSRIHVLEALLRLRQAACHPGLVDSSRRADRSAKLDLLRERLGQTLEEGHKAVVFSQFTSLLALVRAQLEADGVVYEYLDGRTRKRGDRVRRFQEDAACGVFLVSLKAGGHGLNLTAADTVFLLDPWWNPAVEAQAIDRTHRIGQRRPVFAYRIVASGTVEEKILELQERKRRLVDAIVSGATGGLRDLTREDLELLLG